MFPFDDVIMRSPDNLEAFQGGLRWKILLPAIKISGKIWEQVNEETNAMRPLKTESCHGANFVANFVTTYRRVTTKSASWQLSVICDKIHESWAVKREWTHLVNG